MPVLQQVGQRQQQLMILLHQHKEGMTLNDMSNYLEISRTAVQQHVTSLGDKGYVGKGQMKKTVGRPVQSYVLTEEGINLFPKRYAWFTELLLTELKQQLGTEALASLFRSLAENLAKDLQPRFEGKSAQERVKEMNILLDELGYQTMPEITTDTSKKGALEIRACNCVYHNLAREHTEMCQFDIALMEALLGQKVDHAACMAQGDPICRFKIK
jgi:predicted ArsR family transcriptional regulator